MTASKQEKVRDFFMQMQNEISQTVGSLNAKSYREDQWTRVDGGGGRTRIFEAGGTLLEKGGVNFSEVYGHFTPEFAKSLPVGDGLDFYATGISLVLHPINPFAPTVHANYRYLQRGQSGWFGGGADLTPCYLFNDDAIHFHHTLKEALDPFGIELYPEFKKNCDSYFYLPHRKEARGVGGIFFDYRTGDFDSTFSMVQSCARSFLSGYCPILERRANHPYNSANTEWQQIRRGRYVEFNLIYDRGTTFGLKTDGRVESILMSLPAQARWVYDHHPAVGSKEAELVAALQNPREWI